MPVYSHTQLETYRICPKKYEFRYILKPEVPIVETAETLLGSGVHKALNQLYSDVAMEKIPSLEELETCFEAIWRKEWRSGVRIYGNYDAGDYKNIGKKCLKDYYKRNHPFNQSRTLGLDYRAAVSLDSSGRYRMTGFIDRLAKTPDETYEIHDYKTGKHLLSQEGLEADQQLTLYNLLVRQLWPDVEKVVSIWHYLRFDEPLKTVRTVEQVEEAKEKVIARIDEIETSRASGHFSTKTSDYCSWCDYKQICPAWKHLFQLESEKGGIGEADQGRKMVDDYSQLKAQAAELEARIEQVREALLEFAGQNNLTAVFGDGQIARIFTSERPKLPDKELNPGGRQALEKFLKEKKLWDRASDVLWYGINRVLKDRSVPEDLKNKLKELAPLERKPTLQIARRKEVPEED